jgi:hypothetical protein
VADGDATPAAPDVFAVGTGLTPGGAAALAAGERLQVGGLGTVAARAFAHFPSGSYARRLAS